MREVRRNKYFILTDPGELPEVETFKRSRLTDDALQFDEGEARPCCVHGHAIRSLNELGGRCTDKNCGQILCKTCADKFVCSKCDRILCRDHAFENNGKYICSSHGLMAKLRFALRTEDEKAQK